MDPLHSSAKAESPQRRITTTRAAASRRKLQNKAMLTAAREANLIRQNEPTKRSIPIAGQFAIPGYQRTIGPASVRAFLQNEPTNCLILNARRFCIPTAPSARYNEIFPPPART
jgi:hypothetical protein